MRASEVTQLLISYPDAPWGRVHLPAWMVDFYGEHVSKYTIYPWILWDLTNPNLVGMDTGWYQVPVRQSHTIDIEGTVAVFSHYSQGFRNIPGGCLGFLNHQQYWVSHGQLKWLGKTCLRTIKCVICRQLEYFKFLNARWLQSFIELRYSFPTWDSKYRFMMFHFFMNHTCITCRCHFWKLTFMSWFV